MKNFKLPPRTNRQNIPLHWEDNNQVQEKQMKELQQHFMQMIPWEFQNYQEILSSARQYEVRNNLENIYRRRKVPKTPVKSILPNEPCMKLKVVRTSFEKNSIIEFYITSRGMLNSYRNTDHDDIIIGRQQNTPEGIIPNDICLFNSDAAISRVHAKIITKYGFNSPREIPDYFMAFLMMSHKRVGKNSAGKLLYKSLYRYIFSFIKEPKKFWVTDLGSSFGTYLKLNPENIHPVMKGHTYLVGIDTIFNIVEVKNSPVKKTKELNENYEGDQEEFLKFLFRERVYNKCEIHGMTETEENMLELMITNHKELLYGEDPTSLETERSPPCFKRPYLKIEVQSYGGLHSTPNHIFVANPRREFVIGRSQECDVNLVQKTAISRKQSRFECVEGIWYIADGIPEKRSANGTWLSLTDYRLKREKTESEPHEIMNGTEIKINDTVFQVEIFNNS